MSVQLSEELHRLEAGRLRRFFLYRLRNREDAADAAQETFLRLLSVTPGRLIENPQAYLFAIAKSVAYKAAARLRAERHLFAGDSLLSLVAEDRPGQERIVNARECLEQMAKVIDGLPPRCREVFYMSRIQGLPNGEIARRLGISRNMVERHIMRALVDCRRLRTLAMY